MDKDMKLLSVEELAHRWGKDEGTIRKYVREGIITSCKGVPGIMFHPKYIAELEGVELERFSPLQKRRLERELEKAKKENEELKAIIARTQCMLTGAVFEISREALSN